MIKNEVKQEKLGREFEQEGFKKKRRSRKTIGEEGSRKQVVVGLGLTLLLSLIFYLPTEIKNWWSRINQVEVITIERPMGDEKDVSEILGFEVEIKEVEDVEKAVRQLIESLAGKYGVYVRSLEGGEELGVNETEVFQAASVIKLPVLVGYYQAVEAGKLDPKTVYVLKEEDRFEYGTGSMQNQPEGAEYSYREIARLVANESDNMGAELLIKFLGGYGKVEDLFNQMGLERTRLKENETTVKEMGELLGRIYRGELLSEASRDELFENLTDTANESRLPAGVPTGVRVVHKFGSEAGVVNDCGVVYADRPYVICVMSVETSDGEGEEVLAKISRVIWEWMVKN